eukprot:COSAG01_NODE_2839_length_6992_cov_15.825040_2_plen_192_part_00
MLTEICLWHTCSCHEIFGMDTPGQGPQIQKYLATHAVLVGRCPRELRRARCGVCVGAGAGAAVRLASAVASAAVSRSCACIGSPCLRRCGHGASIGGGGDTRIGGAAHRRHRAGIHRALLREAGGGGGGGCGGGGVTDADLVCLFTVRVVGAGSPPPPFPPDDFVSRVSAAVSDWDPPVCHAAVPVKRVLG